MSKEYQCYAKLKAGPGGIGCPCCNPYHCHPRSAKPLMRRFKRRKERQELKQRNTDE